MVLDRHAPHAPRGTDHAIDIVERWWKRGTS
jgi:hypothetical protein